MRARGRQGHEATSWCYVVYQCKCYSASPTLLRLLILFATCVSLTPAPAPLSPLLFSSLLPLFSSPSQFKDPSGDEVREGVVVDPADEIELVGSRGIANLQLKFKFSGKPGNVTVETDHPLLQSVTPDTAVGDAFVPIMAFECRGLEPVAWQNLEGQFTVTTEADATFPNEEGDEVEFEEDADAQMCTLVNDDGSCSMVTITGHRFTRISDKDVKKKTKKDKKGKTGKGGKNSEEKE